MRLRLAPLLLVALLCLPRVATGETTLVRLTYPSGWDGLPAVVAIERGFFAQEDVVVSGMPISSALAAIRSVAAGSSDFAAVPQRTFLVMVASELPVTAVGVGGWARRVELLVPGSDTATASIGDLKGRRIAVGVGSDQLPVLVRLLNQARMRPSDVQIVEADAAQLRDAFTQDLADAVFATEHFTSVLRTAGARSVMSSEDVDEALGVLGTTPLVVNNDVLEKKPEVVQKVVNAWVKAQVYIQQDPDDAANLLGLYFHRQGVPVRLDQARAWVAATRYDKYVWTKEDIADAEYNGWGLKEAKILKVAPKLDGYVDNRFAEQALETLEQTRAVPEPRQVPPEPRE